VRDGKMTKIRLRTKFEIFGALLVIALLVTVSAASLTRTITDSADNSYAFIRNSNGKFWEPMGVNIQAAIDDLGSGGGMVQLPSGILTITSRIYLNSNVALVGGGVGVTRIYSDQSGSFIPITVNGKQNVTVRDLTIDMNSKGSNGLYITGGSKNVWITGISLENVGFQGIYFSTAQYVFVSNIKVKHGSNTASHGFGVLELKDSVIDNCILENYDYDVTEDGIDFNNCNNITLNNIIIKGNGWLDGIKTPLSNKLVMSNIQITDVTNNGFKLQDGADISVNNFYIENVGNIGITCFSDLNGLNLNNGYIINSGLTGLNIESDNTRCSNIEIDDSTVSGIIIAGTCSDLQLTNVKVMNSGSYNKINSGSKNILISNCEFLYGSNYGLSIEGSSNFKISNCIFEGNIGDGIDTTMSACNNYSIISCTFKNNAEGIDCNANDDWNMIALNTFIGDSLDDHFKTKGYIENNIGDDI
jgi:hypothetical protein